MRSRPMSSGAVSPASRAQHGRQCHWPGCVRSAASARLSKASLMGLLYERKLLGPTPRLLAPDPVAVIVRDGHDAALFYLALDGGLVDGPAADDAVAGGSSPRHRHAARAEQTPISQALPHRPTEVIIWICWICWIC